MRAALNFAQTENPKITQSKCWNYFKTTTQARNVFWVNMGLRVLIHETSDHINRRNSSYQNRIQFLEDYFGPPTLPAISLFWSTNMADTTVICILYMTRLRLVICKLLSCPLNDPCRSITRTTLQLNCRSDFVINLG